jgi:uncharacterized membrane protein YheB (UPF0754 family)
MIYPVQPSSILGIKVQGILFRSRQQIAAYIATAVATELKNSGEAFVTSMVGDESLQAVHPMIEAHLDSFLRVKLKEKMPVIAAFIGESTIVKLKEGMMEEITLLLPEVITSFTGKMVAHPEISNYISQRINAVSADTIIDSIPPQLKKMFVLVPIYAAIVGGVIGGLVAWVGYMAAS